MSTTERHAARNDVELQMTAAELELPVILVNAIADSSGPHGTHAPRRDLGRLVLPVRDLRKSAEFYRRVFGFRPRSTSRGISSDASASGLLTLVANRRAELCLRQRSTAPAGLPRHRRWAFVVTDLEYVREKVWELGVRVARDHIFRQRGGASLYVHDPDGNEIELVEMHEVRESPHRPQRLAARTCAAYAAAENSQPS
jgi:catechol 2,3-dioxygenase-like lactoylglutathione lyase family enzyme